MNRSLVARIVISGGRRGETETAAKTFDDEGDAVRWVEQQLTRYQRLSQWSLAHEECYAGRVFRPDGTMRSAYLCDPESRVDWDQVLSPSHERNDPNLPDVFDTLVSFLTSDMSAQIT